MDWKKTGMRWVLPAAMLLTACGTVETRSTEEQLTNARVAVEAAEKLNAKAYAPAEMRYAQDALAIAGEAYNGQTFDRAFSFAKKATIYALVAQARTRQKQAEEKLTQEKTKLEKLRIQTDNLIQSNPATGESNTLAAQGMPSTPNSPAEITPAGGEGVQP